MELVTVHKENFQVANMESRKTIGDLKQTTFIVGRNVPPKPLITMQKHTCCNR